MMLIYFWSIGIGCLLYYGFIRYYTGKWNSTFAGFWVLSGGLHLCTAFFWNGFGDILKLVCSVGLVAVWLLFAVTEFQIYQSMNQRPQADAAYLIVLGAHVNGKRITNSLMRRLDAAEVYLRESPETKVIVSGGQGRGEDVSEADAMAAELILRGIDPLRIIREDQSVSTEENLRFSRKLIPEMETDEQPRVVLVTNNFHIYRALLLGKQVGYQRLSGLPASSNPALQLNYLVREFFAIILTKVRAML